VLLRFPIVLFGLAAWLLLAAGANAASSGAIFPFKVSESTLSNGLQVLVVPYDSPGTVAYYLVVRTGSRDEVEPGHTGFAHFFEHIMFRGTEKYPQERYEAVLKDIGADSNATTGSDMTRYYIVGPAAQLETMMEIEADRFQHLQYTEEVFRTEAQAVLGEYNKNFANPILPLFQEVSRLAYTRHTYRHLTIGFLDDIKAMPGYYDYSRAFFDRFYRPENCTLVVVGDVKPDEVKRLAEKHYGGWKRGYRPADIPVEPPQTGRKTGHVDWPNPIRPQFLRAYHTPAFSTDTADSAALDVIAQLLFDESSPLYQELVVDKQWLDVFSGQPFTRRDPAQFSIYGRVKSADLIPKVTEVIDRHLAELKDRPVDAARLARVKSHLRYQFALGLDTPGNVADQIAEALALTGNFQDINRRYVQYEKLTPGDIERTARAVFRPENETLVTLSHPDDPASAAKPASPANPATPGGVR